jgi:hypothetical protein
MSYFFQGFPTMEYDILANNKKTTVTDIFRAVRIRQNLRDSVLMYKSYHIEDGERPDHVSLKLYGTTDYYWTLFMVNEDIVNTFADWPCSREEMENKINAKYAGVVLTTDDNVSAIFTKNEVIRGSISGATGYIREKESNLGIIKFDPINNITFRNGELIIGETSGHTAVINAQIDYKDAPQHYEDIDGNWVRRTVLGAYPVTNAEHERIWNEYKTDIRVIRPEYISTVVEEFYKQINPDEQ